MFIIAERGSSYSLFSDCMYLYQWTYIMLLNSEQYKVCICSSMYCLGMVRVSWELRIPWERKVVWTVSLINLAPSQYGHIISRFQYTLTKVMDGVDCTCAYPGGVPVQSILGVMPCMVEHLEHLLLSLTLWFLNIACFCLSVSATRWAFSLCALLIVFCLVVVSTAHRTLSHSLLSSAVWVEHLALSLSLSSSLIFPFFVWLSLQHVELSRILSCTVPCLHTHIVCTLDVYTCTTYDTYIYTHMHVHIA